MSDLDRNPFSQFESWLSDAQGAEIPEFNAAALATVSSENRPSARIVLLKDFNEKGFTFFTNYKSRKAKDLGQNPYGSLLFFWQSLERQIRIEGRIEKVNSEKSDEYFKTRSRPSQISAIVSPQSMVVPDRHYLERLHDEYDKAHKNDLKRPGYWGGFRLVPEYFEFWQGRVSRLHDRFRFTKSLDGWVIERLAP